MSNDAPVPYGIIRTPVARGFLASLATSHRLTVEQKIDALQDNPRPEGHEPADAFLKGLTSIATEDPIYVIMYRVDDEEHRIVVMSITPQRW